MAITDYELKLLLIGTIHLLDLKRDIKSRSWTNYLSLLAEYIAAIFIVYKLITKLKCTFPSFWKKSHISKIHGQGFTQALRVQPSDFTAVRLIVGEKGNEESQKQTDLKFAGWSNSTKSSLVRCKEKTVHATMSSEIKN